VNRFALLYFPVNLLGASLDPGTGNSLTLVGRYGILTEGAAAGGDSGVLGDGDGTRGLLDEVKLLGVDTDDADDC
jgi:hypothetical protein